MSVINIEDHNPQEGEAYFLDCNVLMYNFYTNGQYERKLISDYSSIVSKIIGARAYICLTDVLLSEFINTYIQTEFHRLARLNHWPGDKQYFKYYFRQTQEYRNILLELKYIINRQLLPVSKKIVPDFEKICLDDIFENPDTFDFNDRYYIKCMSGENCYIVTNDADFSKDSNCSIITNNRSLLENN